MKRLALISLAVMLASPTYAQGKTEYCASMCNMEKNGADLLFFCESDPKLTEILASQSYPSSILDNRGNLAIMLGETNPDFGSNVAQRGPVVEIYYPCGLP